MEKRKIKLIDKSSFDELIESNSKNINDIFDGSFNELQGGENKIFMVSAEDFLSLKPEIIKYRKLGYRFSKPSALLH